MRKVLFGAILLMVPLSAFGAEINLGTNYFLKGNESVKTDLYAMGPNSTLAGRVEGDVVALSGTIWSESVITGDTLFVGEDVHVLGSVQDDVRVAGGRVRIGSAVGGDVVAIGGEVTTESGSAIKGNLYIIGGDARVAGTVAGKAIVYAKGSRITGAIAGDLEAWGDATFDRATVGGDLILHTNKDISGLPPGLTLGGRVITSPVAENSFGFVRLSSVLSGILSLQIIMSLILAFALYYLARPRVEEVLLDITSSFWLRMLRGLLIFILLPVLFIALGMSLVGLPLAFLVIGLFFAGNVVSAALTGILAGTWLERALFKKSAYPLSYRPVLLGTIFASLVILIPYMGVLVYFGMFLASFGSLGTIFYRHIRNPI